VRVDDDDGSGGREDNVVVVSSAPSRLEDFKKASEVVLQTVAVTVVSDLTPETAGTESFSDSR